MNVEIANRLQTMRKRNGYSQEELAEKIGISRQAVSKWERAEASPDTDNLILLSKLYGVTLDELLRTETSPAAESEGISLRKEDYINSDNVSSDTYREAAPADSAFKSDLSDDGEIYPNRQERLQNDTNFGQNRSNPAGNEGNSGNNYGNSANENEKTGNSANKRISSEFIHSAVDFTADVTKQAFDTAARAFSEADERMKNGETAEKAFSESFTQNFKTFEANSLELEHSAEEAFKDLGDRYAERFRHTRDKHEKRRERREKHENTRNENKSKKKTKYEATLLDKLFPLIITCLFFFGVSIGEAHPSWMMFFALPIYYIFRDAQNRCSAGEISAVKALFRFIDGALPIGITFIFLALGFLFNGWNIFWTLYFILPLYYTGKAAVKKQNLMIFCYPAAAVWAFFAFGLVFREWNFPLIFLATIPFYYITVDHFRKKRKK